MYAKIIRVKCSHSSKPLLGCEIFRKDARLLGAYDAFEVGVKHANASELAQAKHYRREENTLVILQ